MNSQAVQANLILIRRLADGTVEWIPIQNPPQHIPVAPDSAYTVVDRAGYEAPQTLAPHRQGEDLVIEVQGTEAVVLDGFFTVAHASFYPTTSIASGAGPFSGSALTADSPELAASAAAGEPPVWSAGHEEAGATATAAAATTGTGGGSSPLLWVGLAAGGLGLAALAGGGGGSGGESGGGGSLPPPPLTITSGATAAAIAENSAAGQVVYTATATATNGSALTYSLKAGVGDAAAFSINPTTGAVTLTASPNFEAKSSYSFTVVATDSANNTAELAVGLGINNLDEVAPTITSGATATVINENSGAGQVVYTVTSTDTADVSAGSTSYSLKPGGDAAAFTINARSGVVTLTGNPDFEAKPSYTFTVVATDAANNRAEQAVSLAIGNVADTPVTITSGATAAAIAENSAAGQVVYTAVATATSGSAVTYSLKAGGDAAAFSINPTTGAVKLTASPNFEAKSSYNFTVIATDAANNTSEQPVGLGIKNLDEVAPTITSGTTATAINENSGAGQVVYTVTSTDTADISTGVTTYSLKQANDFASFTINATSGAVTLNENPNAEAKGSYSFTVVATDAAGNSSERGVSLGINNLDDSPPTITSGGTAAAINENSGAGQVVYTVTSTDTGDISSGVTTYSLKQVNDFASFTIDATTGAVALNENPNAETKGSYSFTVVATDAAGNSSERDVSLGINNLDEVAPTITSGATAAPITENSGSGQVVYTVTSTDTGDVHTGSTSYSLKAGGDAAAFTINANTGAVALIANPDFETKSSYNFTVVATDVAHNSSEQPVSLAIINVVDETPPAVDHIALTSAVGAQNGLLNAGDTVTVTVTMTENTLVNSSGGTPTIELSIGGARVDASYVSGSGTANLLFDYTIKPGENDGNGISIAPNTLARNGGSITDAAGNVANLSHGAVGNNASFVVDTTAPTLSSSTPADNATHVLPGDNIVLTFSENVQAGSGNIVVGSNSLDTRTIAITDASQVSISGNQVTINPTFDLIVGTQYSVQISGGAITDRAGNPYAGISNTNTLDFKTEGIIVGPMALAQSTSAESSTSFQSLASESINVLGVGSDATLGTVANAWSGSANLGSNDRIMIVSADALDPTPVIQVSTSEVSASLQSLADSVSIASATAFDASLPGASLDGGVHVASLDIPAPILTSQGLVS